MSSFDFIDLAYSPNRQDILQNNNKLQRINNPKKKKIIQYGTRYIKNETINNNLIKINRYKSKY